jgi:hypothetical protein
MTWAVRGLAGFLVAALLTAIGFVVLIPLYGLPSPTLYQEAALGNALLILSWIVLLLDAASGVAYGVGLAGLWGTRRELGKEHATSVEQTLPWLLVTLVLMAAGIVVPSITGPFLTFPGVGSAPPDWTTTLGVVLAGFRAIFAGLVLYYGVQALAPEDARVRLLVAMSLGVVGAILWAGLAAFAVGGWTLALGSLLPFLVGLVAGLGTSAISLSLFVLAYRDIRRGLDAPRS